MAVRTVCQLESRRAALRLCDAGELHTVRAPFSHVATYAQPCLRTSPPCSSREPKERRQGTQGDAWHHAIASGTGIDR